MDCFKLNKALTMTGLQDLQDCKNSHPVHPENPAILSIINNVLMLHQELTKKIIGCAFTVHNTLGAGFLEKV